MQRMQTLSAVARQHRELRIRCAHILKDADGRRRRACAKARISQYFKHDALRAGEIRSLRRCAAACASSRD